MTHVGNEIDKEKSNHDRFSPEICDGKIIGGYWLKIF